MMKFRMYKPVFLGALALSICAMPSVGTSQSKYAFEGVLKSTVEKIVRPALDTFSSAAGDLNQTIQKLCTNPGAANLGDSRAAFKRAAIAWGGIEHFRSGPILENNRLERILFYPDRKSTGLKQVQRRLANKDVSLTDLKSMQTKSVAVQGFGAIEYLLFGTGSNDLESISGSFRCNFAHTASNNVVAIANELRKSWQVGSAYSQSWLSTGLANSVFDNQRESVNELLGVLVHGLEVVRDIRIGSFLKKEPKYDRAKSALLWRSKSTLPVLKANLQMLESMLEEGGLYSLVEDDVNGTVNSLRFEFTQVRKALNSINPPIADALQIEEQRTKILYLKNSIGYLIKRIDGEFALMLGLSSGFSFSDGD